MGMVKCPDCGGMQSDNAFECPHCGSRTLGQKQNFNTLLWGAGMFFLFVGVLVLVGMMG